MGGGESLPVKDKKTDETEWTYLRLAFRYQRFQRRITSVRSSVSDSSSQSQLPPSPNFVCAWHAPTSLLVLNYLQALIHLFWGLRRALGMHYLALPCQLFWSRISCCFPELANNRWLPVVGSWSVLNQHNCTLQVLRSVQASYKSGHLVLDVGILD